MGGRRLMLAITLIFLIAFAALTIHAALDQGFTILTALSLAIIVFIGIGVVGALWEEPPEQ